MSPYAQIFGLLEDAISKALPSDCPSLIGELERLKAQALGKMLNGPLPQLNGHGVQGGPLLTIQQVAARLSVAESYAYELARQGKLHCVRMGKYVRVTEQALAEYQATLAKK